MTDSAALQQEEAPLPTSPEDLMAQLDEIGVNYTLHHHEAVYTVEESQKIDREIPGVHCRNLYLRDRKKKNYLVVLSNETAVDMKKLPDVISSDRLSFGSSDRLWQFLGVRPGSVCPFTVINDSEGAVDLILDKEMMAGDIVNYHPLLNTMTVSLSPDDLIKFFDHIGHRYRVVDLSPAAPA